MYQGLAWCLVRRRGGKGGLTDRERRPLGIGFYSRITENSPNRTLTDHLFIPVDHGPVFGQTVPNSKKSPPTTGCCTQIAEIKKLSLITHELSQNSRSVTGAFFDYDAAISLRRMALTAGVGMPHYLLAPEVCQLLPYLLDLKQRLFLETLWNTGARLNECLALTPADFQLEDESGAVLARPFVVLKTLKQRSRGRGRPSREEQLNRIVPLFDESYAHRLREYFTTMRPKKYEPLWPVASDETPRNWIKAAVSRAERDGVTFTIGTITPKTFRHSFAMHLIQNHVPLKVVQSYMGHTEASSTEVYTKVFALDVGYQRGVRFTVPVNGMDLLTGR